MGQVKGAEGTGPATLRLFRDNMWEILTVNLGGGSQARHFSVFI